MVHLTVEIPAREGIIDAHLYHPEPTGKTSAWPAIILLTDIKGSRKVFEEEAARLAEAGYTVILPNPYYRDSPAPHYQPGESFQDEAVRARLQGYRSALTPDALRGDLSTILNFLAAHDQVQGKETGIIGYCMSGAFALRAAADFPDRIVAAASFHGGGLATEEANSPHLLAPKIKAKLYFGHADQDKSMPVEAITRLETALTAAGIDFTSVLYAGASHGFAVSDGPAYNEAAAARHWAALLELFATTLGKA